MSPPVRPFARSYTVIGVVVVVVATVLALTGCGNDAADDSDTGGDADRRPEAVGAIATSMAEELTRLGFPVPDFGRDFDQPLQIALGKFQVAAGVTERGGLGPQTDAALDARLRGTSKTVRALQAALADVDLYRSALDGEYRPELSTAVRKVQKDQDIPEDGIYGPATSVALAELYGKRHPESTSTVPKSSTVVPSTTSGSNTSGALKPGSQGPEVQKLQQKLVKLGYRPGTPDGVYGAETASAVLAFEKHEGLGRDGVAGPEVIARLAVPTGAGPKSGLPVPRAEVDLARQILFVVQADGATTILNTSTGSGQKYQQPGGGMDVAWTPTGQFAVERKVDAPVQAPLGTLYKPNYFVQGWAIHGAPSVPSYPASHGCVRLSDADADWIYPLIPVGTAVVIYAAPGQGNPINDPPPGAAKVPGY